MLQFRSASMLGLSMNSTSMVIFISNFTIEAKVAKALAWLRKSFNVGRLEVLEFLSKFHVGLYLLVYGSVELAD